MGQGLPRIFRDVNRPNFFYCGGRWEGVSALKAPARNGTPSLAGLGGSFLGSKRRAIALLFELQMRDAKSWWERLLGADNVACSISTLNLIAVRRSYVEVAMRQLAVKATEHPKPKPKPPPPPRPPRPPAPPPGL